METRTMIKANTSEHHEVKKLSSEERDDIVWSVDYKYRLTFFSPSFERQFKTDMGKEPTIGLDLRSMGSDDLFFKTCQKGYSEALQGKSTVYISTIQKPKESRVFEFSFLPYKNITGEIIGCCARQRDISEESEALTMLEDRDQKYKEAQELADVGHWNWDMLKNEISWSDQLFRVFGQEPAQFEATYEALMKIIHPEDREAFNADVEKSIHGKVLHDIVHRIVVADNQTRYVHQRGRAFYDGNGKPYRMAGTTQDVTKDILANQKIIQQNKELEHFVHIVSHNLKGPISNLLMLLDVYQWGRDRENDLLMKKFENVTKALNQTMKDLRLSLSLKNIKTNQFRTIYWEKAMHDVLGLLSEEVEKVDAKITMDFSGAPSIQGIKSYVVNILYNLVLNAMTYQSPTRKPEITILTVREGSSVILNVTDNGIGIDLTAEREKKIFDMYGRLSGKTEGKGLGLYLVKTQVEAMGGSITVESEPNSGSSFILRFDAL